MENKKLRIGLFKHVPEKLELNKNLDDFEKSALLAQGKGVQLFVTCECYLDGYYVSDPDFRRDKLIKASQDLDMSPFLSRVREIARNTSMHIVFGFSMKAEDGIKNAALLIDDKGEDVGVYCKVHLLGQDLNYITGEDLPVFATKFRKIGIMICADRRWPEVARTLKLRGAEVIINPSYGMWHDENEWWMRTRAYENGVYIAFAHPRVSFICSPAGGLEAKLLSNVSDVLVHDINISNTDCEMIQYRRPEVYCFTDCSQYSSQ